VLRRLLESGGEASKALQVVEEHLDQIPLAVRLAIESRLATARRIRVDDGHHAPLSDTVADSVGVVARVRYERFAPRVLLDDRFGDG